MHFQWHRIGNLVLLATLIVAAHNGTAAADSILTVSPQSPLDFKNQDIGTTTPTRAVTVTNSGKTDLTISISITGDVNDFRQTNSCGKPLKAGDLCVVSVQFSPTNADARDGTLVISYPAPDGTTTASTELKLIGHGDVPRLSVAPPRLDFGSHMMASTSPVRTVTLTGNPDSEVQVTSVTASGDFAVTPSTCKLGLSGSCALSVTFAPKQVGETNGSLTIAAQVYKAPSTGTSAGGAPVANTTGGTANSPIITSMFVTLTGEGTANCPITGSGCPNKGWFKPIIPLVIIVLIYLVVLILVRWNTIEVPTRRVALSAIDAVKARVDSVSDASLSDQTKPGLAPIYALLSEASDIVNRKHEGWWSRLTDYLFWNRGQNMAGWTHVHEAEEQLVPFLPPDSVRAALERAESDLRQDGAPPAVALADRINETLVTTPALPADKCRPLLTQFLAYLQPDADLSDRVCRALDPGLSATVADCKKILQDAATALEPTATTKLADQINAALKAAPPAVGTLIPLLQQASSLLDPRAAASLAEKIKNTLADPPPATVDPWKPILGEICAYFKPPTAAALADRIRQALAADPPVPIGRWKALLYEALGLIYDRKDTTFSTLVSWSNKAMYLVCCGLLLIVSLGAVLEHGELFLLGATGGLLSRLMRTLFREDVPTDYGASWTTLFLSPVVGALMGWAGILLAILGYEFHILGSALQVDWCNPTSPVALGLAFLLGFSERAFMGILSQLESKVQANSTTSQPASAAATGPGPKVTSIEPNFGPAAGGTQVTITGTGFSVGAKVTFGGVAATAATVVSKTTVTATAPPHAAGSVDVEVVNADGQKGSLPGGYKYV